MPDHAVADELAETVDLITPASKFALGFLVVYLVGRFVVVPALSRVVRARNRNNPTARVAIERYTRALVVVVALAVGIAVAGYGYLLTQSSLIIAAVTLAIGVAGQEVIGNLVSGLFLVVDPDFNVGDWIVWDDSEGVVETITLRVTRVRTRDNTVVTVPNTELATTAVSRPYGRGRFRVTERVDVDYDADLDEATAIMRAAAEAEEAILSDPEPTAFLAELGADAIALEAHFWLDRSARHSLEPVRSAYVRRIRDRFRAAGIEMNPPASRDITGRIAVDREAPTAEGADRR